MFVYIYLHGFNKLICQLILLTNLSISRMFKPSIPSFSIWYTAVLNVLTFKLVIGTARGCFAHAKLDFNVFSCFKEKLNYPSKLENALLSYPE